MTTETKPKRRGTPRPGTGRPAADPSAPRLNTLSVKVADDIADWIKINGGSAYHAKLLREAFINAHIV